MESQDAERIEPESGLLSSGGRVVRDRQAPTILGRRWTIPDGLVRQVWRWAGLLALLLLGQFSWFVALALLPWGLFAFLFAHRAGCKPWVGWPLALAGLLAVQCVLQTSPSVRQHDVGGHRQYVDYLAVHGTLPPVEGGWETWQPPLYYVVATAWRWVFSAVPLTKGGGPIPRGLGGRRDFPVRQTVRV